MRVRKGQGKGRGRGQPAWRLLVLGLLGVGIALGSSEAAEAGPPKRGTQVLVDVEVDPAVVLLALAGTGGSAWAVWADLQGVASLTTQRLLRGCEAGEASLSDGELPQRFAPIANALGAGALLALALPPLVAERPGRPALAGVGAWLGAWIGYLLGVRSFALGMVAPSPGAFSAPAPAPVAVRLEWAPSEPLRLVVAGVAPGEGDPAFGPCGFGPVRPRTPPWVLWALPLGGAAVGAVIGASYSLPLALALALP